MKARKIRHDKLKKTIYYDHATLKLYDVPIFYFPYFFHPDPTVKRQSGFLIPTFSNSTNVGSGFCKDKRIIGWIIQYEDDKLTKNEYKKNQKKSEKEKIKDMKRLYEEF